MTTALVTAPAAAHTLAGHPESADRVAVIQERLERAGLLADLTILAPEAADLELLAAVHQREMIARVRRLAAAGGGQLDADTYVTGASYDLACLAAGGCVTAVNALLTGQARNGLALVRPPGHHAEIFRSGGFCLFNNVAVAARAAQARFGLRRIVILDFDVHHGNGTQDIFYADPSVLFISLHLYGGFFYPGTGAARETGRGAGRGLTLNIPFPDRVGDRGYAQAWTRLVEPRVRRFQPELILVSAGYDAHWQDPLAFSGLSLSGYAALWRDLVALADSVCQGRVLFVLEGGYYRPALADGVLNTAYALLGQDQIVDPLGPMPGSERDVTDLLDSLGQLHLI